METSGFKGSIPVNFTMGNISANFETLLLTGDDGSITPQFVGINYTAATTNFSINTNKKVIEKLVT